MQWIFTGCEMELALGQGENAGFQSGEKKKLIKKCWVGKRLGIHWHGGMAQP